MLGVSIGSGEFLLGPAVFVRHGLSLLWVTAVAVFFQTVFNTELMRYTLATGEPVFTGFMRTRPASTFWAWFYAVLYFLQVGWPAWAGTAAGRDLLPVHAAGWPAPADATPSTTSASATFLLCVAMLLLGRRIERTLEMLNWVLVAVHPGRASSSWRCSSCRSATWAAAVAGFAGLRHSRPAASTSSRPDTDFFLLGALVAYSGGGGVTNITLSNWARDKGYGMGAARRLHPRRGRRHRRCTWRTPASSSSPTPRPCGAGAAGGASSAPISGASSSPARCSA